MDPVNGMDFQIDLSLPHWGSFRPTASRQLKSEGRGMRTATSSGAATLEFGLAAAEQTQEENEQKLEALPDAPALRGLISSQDKDYQGFACRAC